MKHQSWIVICLTILLILALTACTRSASKAPVPTSVPSGELPFPTPAANAMQLILTQTAQAGGVPSQPPVVEPAGGNPVEAPTLIPPTETLGPTMVPVPSATPGLPVTYTLHLGEHPYCIARRFNLDPGELMALNNLTASSLPGDGTVLQIPAGTTWPAGSRALLPHPTTYTVSEGETIYSIACDFGDVDPNAIVVANALQSPFTLTAGQVIHIP